MTELLEQGSANFMGFERIDPDGSKHRQQKVIRGNGALTLTDIELRFVRALPTAEFVVPLADVVGVEIGKGHNGKRVWRYPALKVGFKARGDAPEGELQIIGLMVGRQDEAERWAGLVSAAVREAGGDPTARPLQ